MRKLLIISLLLFPSAAVSAQQPNASDIFKQVAEVYSGCRSYSDDVSVNYKVVGFAVPYTFQEHYHTAYIGPDHFRFEIPSRGLAKPWIIWKDGDAVESSGASGSYFHPQSLDVALSTVAFASHGGSLLVPPLLMPKSVRTTNVFSVIANATVAGEEKMDGHAVYRIEGTMWDEPITLWIDRTQYLILKIYRRITIGSRVQEVMLQFKPKLNPEISRDRFTPPKSDNQSASNSSGTAIVSASNSARVKDFGSSLWIGAAGDANRRQAATDDDVVRVDTDLVVLPVLVIQPDGKIINGLTKDDFIVKESDQPQQVSSFSRGDSKEMPRSIVLIIDYSASQLPYIRTSIESAKQLVDKLNPKDRMAIVTDDVRLLVDFTSDKQLLKSQLETLKTSALAGNVGASDQFDSLMATLTEIFNSGDVRPIVIFQTDGDELDNLKGNLAPSPYWLPRRFSLQDVMAAAEKSRVTIYPVISGVRYAAVPEAELVDRALNDWLNRQAANEEIMRARKLPLPKERPNNPMKDTLMIYATQWRTRQIAMVQLARLTGAWPEFLEEPAQADEIYTRILTDIDRRYIIGYYPTNRTRDGKRRQVSVEVRGHPEYLVWGQKSYFAREEK